MANLTTAARLTAWRLRNGLTQVVASDQLGVSQGTWGAWESGAKSPDLGNALSLEILTKGEVKASDWPKRRRRRRKSARKEPHERPL